MKYLHIIMPMAGEGSRFMNNGWSTPKPLINLNNKPLFMHAIDSINIENIPIKYSFIVRKEHIAKYNIDNTIKAYLPNANIFFVEKTTRGAVETCMIAESAIDNDDAILVLDCDLHFNSISFNNIIKSVIEGDTTISGALVSFNSNDPKYSYAEIDNNNIVIRTAEKEVISNNALCGAYFFSNGSEFKSISKQLINEANFKKSEFYVSLLYNYILRNNSKVVLTVMDEYHSYGTPDELKQYM